MITGGEGCCTSDPTHLPFCDRCRRAPSYRTASSAAFSDWYSTAHASNGAIQDSIETPNEAAGFLEWQAFHEQGLII
jgi:hypothetical protein